jgi:co-chaperonin GroES (HSP10)
MLENSQRVDLNLEPLDDFVVIQPTDEEAETRSGLILPASVQDGASCRSGIVTAAGPDVTGVEPGDKVLFPQGAGYEVRIAGSAVKLLRREDLIARLDP